MWATFAVQLLCTCGGSRPGAVALRTRARHPQMKTFDGAAVDIQVHGHHLQPAVRHAESAVQLRRRRRSRCCRVGLVRWSVYMEGGDGEGLERAQTPCHTCVYDPRYSICPDMPYLTIPTSPGCALILSSCLESQYCLESLESSSLASRLGMLSQPPALFCSLHVVVRQHVPPHNGHPSRGAQQ